MKIVSIIGARPQFIKAAILSRLIRQEYSGIFTEYLVHTGQHYDANMSEIFFREMQIPQPDLNLDVGSGTHGRMTGEMLIKIEEVLLKQRPEFVLVYGDTNSTLAGALAASKLDIPVAHVEAGLRSYFKKMPEEQNRVLTDYLATLLFCPTDTARKNLAREGITEGVHITGDIMYDSFLFYNSLVEKTGRELTIPLPRNFYLLTLHRAENTDDFNRLSAIIETLNSLTDFQGIFPVHPRTRKIIKTHGLTLKPQIQLIEPVGFLDMVMLEQKCDFVVTDSGGIQKEAFFFKKPCITLRDQTEWVETVASGWNILAGADKKKIINAFHNIKIPAEYLHCYGNGDTGKKILDIIKQSVL